MSSVSTVDDNVMVINTNPSMASLKEEQVFFPTKRGGKEDNAKRHKF